MATLLLGLGLGLLISAASAGRRSVKDGGILLIGIRAFDFIDPALVIDPSTTPACGSCQVAAWAVEDSTCSMLVRYPSTRPPSVRFDFVPEVATGYPEVSRDGRTYTFTIRKGFRFSTGAPVTAANYASAIMRVRDRRMDSPAAGYVREVVGVHAVGARLIVRLRKKLPDFPARLTMPYFCPVPTDLPIAPEGVGAPLPGSGPYYISEFVRGSRVVLKRNPYYGGTRPHHVDQIVFDVGDEQLTINHEVVTGERDVDVNPPISTLGELGAKYGVNEQQFFSVRSANVYYVWMNTERPLFRNNPTLRQAVNFALDRTAMLRAFGQNYGSRTDSYLPPGLPGYLNVHPYPVRHPDFAKARELARGHRRSGKAVMYTCDANPALFACLAHAQIVQYDLKQIGIDVEIKAFPTAVYAAKIGTRGEAFDLMGNGVIFPWVDPYLYVNLLLDGRTIRATGNRIARTSTRGTTTA